MVILDPRSKLYLLLLSNMILLFHVSTCTEILLDLFLLFPLLIAKKYKSVIRFTIMLVVLFLLGLVESQNKILNSLILFSYTIRTMLPCFIAGSYAFTTTTISEFVVAMRKMKISEGIIIPFMVVIRFFPTIIEDYKQIRDALSYRGITTKNPLQYFEYILIPLLMNANNVADDLTVASMSKGISISTPHTSLTTISMHYYDYLYMIIATMPLIAFIGGLL